MVYDATLRKYQRVMHWVIIIKVSGTNIHHMYGVDNIVSDILSRLPTAPNNQNKSMNRKSQCYADDLFMASAKKAIVMVPP